MKIVRMGKTEPTTKRITCEYCGCIFEAEREEYNITSQLGVMHDGLQAYNCICPCCKKSTYFD